MDFLFTFGMYTNKKLPQRRHQGELEQLLEERNMMEKPCAVPNRAAQGSLFEIFR